MIREEAKREMMFAKRNVIADSWIDKAYNMAIKALEQPEIVRCKDCKHYYFADNRIPQEHRYTCELDGDRWKPDDYCSYAERRTDGAEREDG